MTDVRNTRNRRKRVRASIIRRTVVGSLVVMLSPFLTVLDHDASASDTMRKPVVLDSSPAIERSIEGLHHTYTSKDKVKSLPLSQRGEVEPALSPPKRKGMGMENGSIFAGIEASLRQEANLYWLYDNVAPEAQRGNLREQISP